jgi:hypothetical protein
MIPCGHTYCTKCLDELCAGSETITCPQCRQENALPKNGVSQLPKNLSYQQLLDIRTEQLVSTRQCQVRRITVRSNNRQTNDTSHREMVRESIDVCSDVLHVVDCRCCQVNCTCDCRYARENEPFPTVFIVKSRSVSIVNKYINKN